MERSLEENLQALREIEASLGDMKLEEAVEEFTQQFERVYTLIKGKKLNLLRALANALFKGRNRENVSIPDPRSSVNLRVLRTSQGLRFLTSMGTFEIGELVVSLYYWDFVEGSLAELTAMVGQIEEQKGKIPQAVKELRELSERATSVS